MSQKLPRLLSSREIDARMDDADEIKTLRADLAHQQVVVKAAESIFAFILTRSTPPSLERLTKEIEPLGKAFVDLAAFDAKSEGKG